MGWNDRCDVSAMRGLTLRSVVGAVEGDDRIIFEATDGQRFVMYHSQDCCESVSIHTVTGCPDDLIGSPLLEAEEVSGTTLEEAPEGVSWYDSYTWTFYKLGTIKGHVTIAWLGTSNGYYSESVDFERLND